MHVTATQAANGETTLSIRGARLETHMLRPFVETLTARDGTEYHQHLPRPTHLTLIEELPASTLPVEAALDLVLTAEQADAIRTAILSVYGFMRTLPGTQARIDAENAALRAVERRGQ